MAFEPNNVRALGRNSTTGSYIWLYASTTDDLATMLADDYFEAEDLDLAVNDMMILQATDAPALVMITAVDGTAPNPCTIVGLDAQSVFVNTANVQDAGGTTPEANVEAFLDYLAERVNQKVEQVESVGVGGVEVVTGVSDADETARVAQFRTISGVDGVSVSVVDDVIVISGSGTTPTPGEDNRSDEFNSGLRRLHVAPGTFVDPIDGTSVDAGLQFTNLQTAIDALQAGDVLTIAAGDYFSTTGFSRSGFGTAGGDPIWIAEEQLGTVRILRVKEAAFNGTQTWTDQGGGRYSAAIGDTYMGTDTITGDFLPKYSSIANLDASSVNGKNKPQIGCCVVGSTLHVRLRNNADPNGRSLIFPFDESGNVVDFDNADEVIWDGCEIIGGGEQSGITFDSNSANPVIRNVRTTTSRFLARVPSDTIVTWCSYGLGDFDQGAAAWMREVVSLNGNEPAAFFDIIKGDLADGGNALYEGGICAQSGTADSDCEFSFNWMKGVFDGARFGEFINSVMHSNVGEEIGDDWVQFESDNTSNDGDGNEAFFNRIRNPHGPVFSHQNSISAHHEVYRNLVEITEPSIFRPLRLIKMIRTADNSNIRYWQNYFEHFGTSDSRSIWYQFGTPDGTGFDSGGAQIELFINNVVVFPGGISSNSGGVPETLGDNAVIGPSSTDFVQGTNGFNAGTAKADLGIDDNFVPQSGSALIGAGRDLPTLTPALPTDPTTIDGSREIGVFESNEAPGADWPRAFGLLFDQELPPRWTSPGVP